jgi:hypothetical protein
VQGPAPRRVTRLRDGCRGVRSAAGEAGRPAAGAPVPDGCSHGPRSCRVWCGHRGWERRQRENRKVGLDPVMPPGRSQPINAGSSHSLSEIGCWPLSSVTDQITAKRGLTRMALERPLGGSLDLGGRRPGSTRSVVLQHCRG